MISFSHEARSVLDLLHFKKVPYGDIRLVNLKQRTISAKNGHASIMEDKESTAFGIRVLKDGAWGFSNSTDLSKASLEKAVGEAIRIAGNSARLKKRAVRWPSLSPVRDYWETECRIDPWQISPREQMNYLLECEKKMRVHPKIRFTESRMEFTRKAQLFASTESRWIESLKTISGGGIYCKAVDKGEIQKRSYPSPSREHRSQGYEAVRAMRLLENADRTADEALKLLKAKPCPSGTVDLILRGSILALQLHESIGHAVELDRVYGHEDNFGGRTYLVPGLRGKRIASSRVTVVANAAANRKGAGVTVYDDEGVKAQETKVVEKGVFKNYLSSRETAARLGSKDLSGSMIAEDGTHFPILRMTDLSLVPGKRSFDEILSCVKEGILIENESSWSIDEGRDDFQIGGELAWQIRKGKVVGFFKNPLYRGKSLDFWRKCSDVADAASSAGSGFSDCGKGAPYQQAFVSHTVAPSLFRGVECYASAK